MMVFTKIILIWILLHGNASSSTSTDSPTNGKRDENEALHPLEEEAKTKRKLEGSSFDGVDSFIDAQAAATHAFFLDDSHYYDYDEEVGLSAIPVRKCCRRGEAYFQQEGRCQPSDADFTARVLDLTFGRGEFELSDDQMDIIEGPLTTCDPPTLQPNEYVLKPNGDLFFIELSQTFDLANYCLENIFNHSAISPSISTGLKAAYCPVAHLPRPFDPSKIPVRKCCSLNELRSSQTTLCELRGPSLVEWEAPLQDLGYVRTRAKNFTDIYEVIPGYPECRNHERGEFLSERWKFHVTPEGGLSIPSLGISSPHYCIDSFLDQENQTSSYAYVCLSEEAHRGYIQMEPGCQNEADFCVDKCCDPGQILSRNGNCISDNSESAPSAIYAHNSTGHLREVEAVDFMYGSPFCEGRGIFITKEEERAEILFNGSLRYISYDPNECEPHIIQIIPKGEYCYDTVSFEDISGESKNMIPGALICYPDSSESLNRQATQVNYIYSIFLAISDIFILISFIIYLTVPDQTKRGLNKNVKLGHSILGRILLSFLFSLFFAYLCLIISKTASDPINVASNVACISLGVIMYISFLATFFWLNTLCFELWWKCARQESTSGRRWIWYQIYAWGNPLLLGTIVLYIEFSPLVGPCFVKPNFGIQSCFFSETRTFGSAAKWIYLNGPVAILLTVDLIFFILTVKSLLQTVQQSHKGTVRRQARQRLKLCFKLFLVMGICWLTEIISAVTETKWYVTEVFNCLQGFVIFLIFILKPKILEAVKNRFRSCCCGEQAPVQPPRGTMTFTASSILSDFFSSTMRQRYPHPGAHNLSVSSFSTTSSSISWGNGSLYLNSPSSSPAVSQKISRRNPFLTIQEGSTIKQNKEKTCIPSINVVACSSRSPTPVNAGSQFTD